LSRNIPSLFHLATQEKVELFDHCMIHTVLPFIWQSTFQTINSIGQQLFPIFLDPKRNHNAIPSASVILMQFLSVFLIQVGIRHIIHTFKKRKIL